MPKQIEPNQQRLLNKNCCNGVFYPTANDPDHGVKMQQNFFIFASIYHIPEWI